MRQGDGIEEEQRKGDAGKRLSMDLECGVASTDNLLHAPGMALDRWRGSDDGSRRDYEPLFYWKGIPFDLTTLLIAAHCLAMLGATLVLMAGRGDLLFAQLAFSPESLIRQGKVWTMATYAFLHDIRMEGLWFAVGMVMLWWFGRPVEQFIGRRAFGWLYGLMILCSPLLLTILAMMGGSRVLTGSGLLHLGVFVAFATIYPGAQMFFGMFQAKWVAWIFLGILSLAHLASLNFTELLLLWTTAGTAFGFLHFVGVRRLDAFSGVWSDWMARRSEARLHRRIRRAEARMAEYHQTVDDILDKISREGIASLTESERRTLEAARAKLLAKDKER